MDDLHEPIAMLLPQAPRMAAPAAAASRRSLSGALPTTKGPTAEPRAGRHRPAAWPAMRPTTYAYDRGRRHIIVPRMRLNAILCFRVELGMLPAPAGVVGPSGQLC